MLEMNMQLCKVFPALTPFAVRRERAVEVFALVRRINSHPAPDNAREVSGRGNVRRPAGDDWF